MKNIAYITASLLLSFFTVFQSLAIEVSFAYARLWNPEKGHYIENYLNFRGNTVRFVKNEKGMYQSEIEVTYIFSKNDSIQSFDKFIVKSPELSNPDSLVSDFLDQRRYPLSPGKYTLEILVKDLNTNEASIEGKQIIEMKEAESNTAYFSDIKLLDRNSAGANLPYTSDYFPESMAEIAFYVELYAPLASKDEMGLIRSYIQRQNGEAIEDMSAIKRIKLNQIVPYISAFNIEGLETGRFALVLELVNTKNEIVSTKTIAFNRFNPILNKETQSYTNAGQFISSIERIESRDTLLFLVQCLGPILNPDQQVMIRKVKSMDDEQLKNYFIDYWMEKDPSNPGKHWAEYYKEVQKAEVEFATKNQHGFQTDRGIAYLKYGPPNTIVKRENDPSSYPYHIWHYYKHPMRSDARYVFVNRDLVTKDYTILHSNVIGEVNNPNWQRDLQIRNTPWGDVDRTQGDQHWGDWSNDLFNMPR